MASEPAVERTRRRRRRPEEAEGEILAAAEALLRERPLHEVTVDAIMRRTSLSRKSFYVYFADRYDVLRRLAAPLRAELDEANALALGERDDGRAALLAVARALRDHGMLIRSLAEASYYDPAAERLWRDFNEPVIAAFAQKIQSSGRTRSGTDPEALARVLVGMNLYAFFDRVVGRPDADLEAVVAPLHAVWRRVLAPR